METQNHWQDPYAFFDHCFSRAKALALPQFDAMALATSTPEAVPSVRMVLLKGVFSGEGFAFFTNLESRKGQEILSNPHGQLLFYWPDLGRQIRVEGKMSRLSDLDSDAYWATRPRGSQIGALASQQSRPLSNARDMEAKVAELERQFQDRDIPRPSHWGGVLLRATRFEFWEDRPNRLHERIVYEKLDSGWKIYRLWP